MALKSTKISREVLNSYKQLIAHKPDIATISCSKRQASRSTEVDDEAISYADENNTGGLRYVVTNTEKPEILPKIEFPKNPEQLIPPEMRYLQPAMLPKFMELREDPENTKWEVRENIAKAIDCPFPEPIKELRTETIRVSDKQKAEMKMPSTVRVCFTNTNRSFSTLPFWVPERSMTSKNECHPHKCNDSHKNKNNSGGYNSRAHCDNDAAKIDCDTAKRTGCPRIVLRECVQSKGSDCNHHYVDPKCRKKNAPYPSYSESCAERLEEDPSECMQCPWQKCGGVEAIKPQKRKFHHMVSPGIIPFQIPPSITSLYSPDLNNPCKRPPGKCEQEEEVRRREKAQKEDRRVERSRHQKKEPDRFDIVDGLFASEKKSNVPKGKLPFDKNLGDYEYVRKRRCSIDRSKCEKEKRKIVPDHCYSDDCKKCSQREQSIMAFLNYKCKSKNPKEDCPPIKISPAPGDLSIDFQIMELSTGTGDPNPCEKNKKKEKPQCPRKPEEKHDICPKDKDHKIKYRTEKDLTGPTYRKED